MSRVRLRFAPSPTGLLHLGGLRTALYNAIIARSQSGKLILRVEDTDKARCSSEFIKPICDALTWAGIAFDESPTLGGKYGPYVQSQCHAQGRYRNYAEQLVQAGAAYRCYCSKERLEEIRKQQGKRGFQYQYDRTCRDLPADQAPADVPHSIRLKMPLDGRCKADDLVLGKLTQPFSQQDDAILIKSEDGNPTYHLASVVDDCHMRISHVIRGQEWLPSLPKHLVIYEGLNAKPPRFGHLPLLLDENRAKLSKRSPSGHSSLFDVLSLRGTYLPEALLNFIALCGWTPPDGREILTFDEMVSLFKTNKIHKSNAVVVEEKLRWINRKHIQRRLDEEAGERRNELVADVVRILDLVGEKADPNYVTRVLKCVGERLHVMQDISAFGLYFFRRPVPPSGGYPSLLTTGSEFLSSLERNERVSKEEMKAARQRITGMTKGPSLLDIVEIIGREEARTRLDGELDG